MRKYLWIGIGILIALNIYRTYQRTWSFADPIDFRGLFLGAELLSRHENIYEESKASTLWLDYKDKEDFKSNTDFGDQWVSVMSYPPQTFTLLFPLSYLSWTQARLFWWIFCALCLGLVVFAIYRKNKDPMTIGLILAFKGTAFALFLGQPMLLALFLLTGAYLVHQKNEILAGMLFGLALFKFTLAIPFGFWFLLKKQYRILGVTAVTCALLLIPTLIMYPGITGDYLEQISKTYAMIYDAGPSNPYTFSNSELTIILDYLFDQDINIWKITNIVGQLIGYGLLAVIYFKKGIEDHLLLLGACLVSFVFSYHLVYDALLLLVPILLLERSRIKNLSILIVLIFSFPINALSNNVLLNFHYPIAVAMAWILLIFVLLQRKPNGSQHPSY